MISIFYAQEKTPTFRQVPPICVGGTLDPLPTTSLEGFTGTWSPDINNLGTLIYTFTPHPGQSAGVAYMQIEAFSPMVPTFHEVNPVCYGSYLPELPTTSIEGINGEWTPSLNNTETTSYLFTPYDGQCASQSTLTIEVLQLTTPLFSEVDPICYGGYLAPLPTTSLEGITGTWTPAINTSQTTIYTFTPNSGQCASSAQLIIEVLPQTTPTFDEVPAVCSENSMNVLPSVSNEGISGTWSPEFSSTKSNEYTFIPDDGQCAVTTTLKIEVLASETPVFDEVAGICSDEYLKPLPEISNNGISGTWSPELDNTVTTTYTFTPGGGQCASTVDLTITVNPKIPEFKAVEPICYKEHLDELPTTSINGFTGEWSPQLDTSVTTSYTFTPTEGQCASPVSLTIVVNQYEVDFEDLIICTDTTIETLPLVSSNGVQGSWKDNGKSFSFLPDGGQCAKDPVTIPVAAMQTPVFEQIAPIEAGGQLELPGSSENGISGTWSPEPNNYETTTYYFTPFPNQCAEGAEMTVEVALKRFSAVQDSYGDSLNAATDIQGSPVSMLAATGNSAEVGVTRGDLSVSPSGAAIYNIPIAVPPGINGVVPQLSITYSSQAGPGRAGYGWNISGLSSITRIASTKYHDGLIDPVDFDTNDRFALDGQRLMLKSGTYGGVNSTYETEGFTNTKITFTGSYFKVEYPDGTSAYYGQTEDSKAGISYAISYWENPHGNRIRYEYVKSNNISFINTIKYGSVTGVNPINEIKFYYVPRKNKEQYYVSGFNFIDDKLVSCISTKGNGIPLRNYYMSYDYAIPNARYERLVKVIEKNGAASKSYNPTNFTYENEDLSTTIVRSTKPNFIDGITYEGGGTYFDPSDMIYIHSASQMTFKQKYLVNGDFDGDGDQDFVYNKKLYTKVSDVGPDPIETDFTNLITASDYDIEARFPVKILIPGSGNSYKLFNRDAWCFENKTFAANNTTVEYEIFGLDQSTNAVKQYSSRQVTLEAQLSMIEGYTGDFNGDGLTDRLIIKNSSLKPMRSGEVLFVNLDPRLTSNYVKNLGYIHDLTARAKFESANTKATHTYIADMNGDGKSDIVVFKGGSLNKISVYSLDSNEDLVMLFESPVALVHNNAAKGDKIFYEEKYIGKQPIGYWPWEVNAYEPHYYDPIFGDWNGDGKSDIILPGLERKVLMSTGIYLAGEALTNTFPPPLEYNSFIPTDFNGDGKTDIVAMRKLAPNSFSTNIISRLSAGSWTSNSNSFSNSNSTSCGTPQTDLQPFMIKTSKAHPDRPQILVMEYHHYVPCLVDFKIGFYTNKNVWSSTTALQKVTYGNGMRDFVYYAQLTAGSGIYSPAAQIENYPNYDICGSTTSRAVEHLSKEITPGNFKHQFYKYYGATSNVEGLGFLGFRATMNTNWFTNMQNAISTITQADIALRGAPVQSFSVEGIVYPTKVLLPTDPYISKSVLRYNNNMAENPILGNKVFKLRNTSAQLFNGLDGTITDITSTYDLYNLKTKKTVFHGSNTQDSKTIDEVYTYDDLPLSGPYMIGRPKSKTLTTRLLPSNDVCKNEEVYTYAGILLMEVKKRSINSGLTTEYITEANQYDTYGNITKKTLSAPNVANRVTTTQFDTQTHRFPVKITDIYGLSTNYTYDMSNGSLLTEILPSNPGTELKTVHNFDSWGKVVKTTKYIGNTPILTHAKNYSNVGENILVTTSGNDGSGASVMFDHLGRKTHVQEKNISDKWSCVSTVYDVNNNPIKVSQPYFIAQGNLGNFSVWNEMQYDKYGRIIQSNALKSLSSNGKQVTYSYSGATATENNGQKQKTTTKNSYGAVASVSESGGETVNYSYFANGNLKSTYTSDASTIIEQDGFGRKVTLVDPSAGTFRYTYDNYGSLLSEEAVNKGLTTYKLDDYGRIVEKTVKGFGDDLTNTKTQYSFNSFNLLQNILHIDTANDYRISYNYDYDNYNRLKYKREMRNSTVNSMKFFDFQREFLYDGFSRVDREKYYAKDVLTNKVVDKWIKTTYKNGHKFQLFDMLSSTAVGTLKLWQTNTTNAKGAVLSATLGNNVDITNIYDSYGFPAAISHNKGSSNIISLFTIFNATDQNLKYRQYIMPNMPLTENLAYDSFDRLTKYKNGKNYVTQSYNTNGTISNNIIGKYDYTLQGQPYTQTSVTPTDQSLIDYYAAREQNIDYNVFNSPVTIDEQGVEKIDFEYNPFNQRAVMYYGDTEKSKKSRQMRKFYSADGTMEIRRRTLNGGTVNDFTFYIGGDGYSAPVILRGNGTSKEYYYLHRDYQGSIMAITGITGNVVERRMFDAWGSIIAYNGSDKNIPTTSTSLLLDRGYTGHEHHLGVGLINMNGRIYEPKFHRFLQPDANIQDPFNIQNYNRYGYCMNNPTKYSDPSGEFWGFVAGFLFSAYVHGAQATGQANPLKWNAGEYANAFMAPVSPIVSALVTNYANNYVDNYNVRPELAVTANTNGADYSYAKNNNKMFTYGLPENPYYNNVKKSMDGHMSDTKKTLTQKMWDARGNTMSINGRLSDNPYDMLLPSGDKFIPDGIEFTGGGEVALFGPITLSGSLNVTITGNGIYAYPTVALGLNSAPGGWSAGTNFLYSYDVHSGLDENNLSGFSTTVTGSIPVPQFGLNVTGSYIDGGTYYGTGIGISNLEMPNLAISRGYTWDRFMWKYKF